MPTQEEFHRLFNSYRLFPNLQHHRVQIAGFLAQLAFTNPRLYEERLNGYNKKAEELGVEPFEAIDVGTSFGDAVASEEEATDESVVEDKAEELGVEPDSYEESVSLEEGESAEVNEAAEEKVTREERARELRELKAKGQKDLIAELGIETDATNEEGRVEAILSHEFPSE